MSSMGLYETFLLGFAILVILAGIAFSVLAVMTPSPQKGRRTVLPVDVPGSADNSGSLNGT